MPCLDVFQLYDMFANARSMAIVGNAGSILNYQNGPIIDSYDIVVRFNRAYTKGVEDKIGSRTDILVANIGNTLDRAPAPAEALNPQALVCFVTKSPKGKDVDSRAFRQWIGDVPALITFAPDIRNITQAGRTRQFLNGTYALYAFLSLFEIERLFLTGFTFYSPVAAAQKYYEPEVRLLGFQHDLDEDARVFCEILAAFKGQLEMTPEVTAALQRSKSFRGGAIVPSSRAPSFANGVGRRIVAFLSGLRRRIIAKLAWTLLSWGFSLRRRLERKAGRVVAPAQLKRWKS